LGEAGASVDARLEEWRAAGLGRGLWAKDPTVWFDEDVAEISDRLGWLDLPATMAGRIEGIERFAEQVCTEGTRHVVLLGMGGSSLAPEVFAAALGAGAHYPELIVLDSTHPKAVLDVERRIDIARTLFLVSSKSGTTLETLSLFKTFWRRMGRSGSGPGRRFVAITDAGSPLADLAAKRGFRNTFLAPADVGGRYSALSVFGLVPAALTGMDIRGLLTHARVMAEACGPEVAETENPALALGAALAELAHAGRDKLTFLTSPRLSALPAWIEQLIAESIGKDGIGIVPVAGEAPGIAEAYGDDRFFVSIRLAGDEAGEADEPMLSALLAAGHPLARIELGDVAGLAQEMFRWQMAVAAAAAALGVHPFDQPDVEIAKELARQAMAPAARSAEEPEVDRAAGVSISIDAGDPEALAQALSAWIGDARPGDYVALQAYLAPTDATLRSLADIRLALRDRLTLAVTLGFGPRFLHSTGQLHKGGPDNGLFLQLVDEPDDDIAIPETGYGFAALIRAQALGDLGALKQRRRRVLRVNLGTDTAPALAALAKALGA
jgi:transaldolase/glucose-6-phosphate isomerase